MDYMAQRSDEALIRQATTTRKGRSRPANLREQVDERVMQLWPTPQARDYRSADDPDSPRVARKAEQGWSPNLNDAVKLWPTPRASDGEHGGPNQRDSKGNFALSGAVHHAALWPIPRTQGLCGGTGSFESMRKYEEAGYISTEERKQMTAGNGGQLNPDWVECLMGFPIGWTDIDRDETESHWIEEPRWPAGPNEEQYEWEPPRVATGVKNRVPRLKACGNAVVPAHAYPFMAAIKAVHEGNLT